MKAPDNKEFDDLFRSTLENLEVSPADKVWNGIAEGLGADKRRKAAFSVLNIAASVVLLIVAGFLVIRQQADTKHAAYKGTKNHKASNNLVTAKNGGKNITSNSSATGQLIITMPAEARLASAHYPKVTRINKIERSAPPVKKERELPIPEQSISAAIPQKQQDIIRQDVPDESTSLPVGSVNDEPARVKIQPAIQASQPVLANTADIKPDKAKHRIRSLGDFINVVVAKVDKRKDKIIEFTDTDDDESDVTGVNLGIIKIKKAK